MGLTRQHHRVLVAVEAQLRSDCPALAAMFAVFTHAAAGEVMPQSERVPRKPWLRRYAARLAVAVFLLAAVLGPVAAAAATGPAGMHDGCLTVTGRAVHVPTRADLGRVSRCPGS